MDESNFTPGYRFKDRKLYVFAEQQVAVIDAWPKLTAVSKHKGAAKWRDYWPTFRLIYPYRRAKAPQVDKPTDQLSFGFDAQTHTAPAAERKRALDAFRFAVPKDVAKAVEPFLTEQWSMLHLVKADPLALHLMYDNPALAFLLAHHYIGYFRGHLENLQFSHVNQRALAHHFDFAETDATVNILKKVPAESLSLRRMESLRAALADSKIQKILSHLEVVNAGAIEMVADPEIWQMCTPKLLQEVSECRPEKYRAITTETLNQVLIMQRTVNPGRTPSFQSREQLRRVHDELTVEYCRRAPDKISGCVFPRPPLPGMANCIVPLRTPAELTEEGKRQNNCVATYAKRVEQGLVFIYRVLHPERATLSVVRADSGSWGLGELTATGNSAVTPATEQTVEAWLAQHSLM